MSESFAIIVVVAIMFVALPAVVLHYMTQWRKSGALSPDDEHMLEDVWKSAKKMERRIDALESILDSEAPGWRRGREDE